jgi:hypothetical protein
MPENSAEEIVGSEWPEWDRLFGEFTAAIAEMIAVQAGIVFAASNRGKASSPFDVLMQAAVEKKRRAKDALRSYIDELACD